MRIVEVQHDGHGAAWSQVAVPEPGEPGYPPSRLPEGAPGAGEVNAVIDEMAASASPGYLPRQIPAAAAEAEAG